MLEATQPYGRVFPLYVPPIDWYFLIDDSPAHPMVFYIELTFAGNLDRDAFDAALTEALQRHPLLYSLVQPAKRNRLCWVPAPKQMPTVDWGSSDAPTPLEQGEYIDLKQQPGLRVWARPRKERIEMTLQFHHATTDGTGAYRFIGDLLGCYMQRLKSCAGQVQLGDLDIGQLKNRPAKMRGYRAGEKPWKKLRLALHEGRRQFLNRVEPLRVPSVGPRKQKLPGIVHRQFAKEQLAALRNTATQRGATMNDLMVCRMLTTAQQWNGRPSRRDFRILVPSDTRDGTDFALPACNMTAYTFVGARTRMLGDEGALLDLVRGETLEIKNGNLQKSFINGLTTVKVAPFVLPLLLKHRGCFATSVLSNAGDPSRRFTCRLPKRGGKISCDDFSLEAITGVPPLRRSTHCTLSSSTYGRRLTFSMRCSPRDFSEQDTRDLLQLFCQHLQLEPAE